MFRAANFHDPFGEERISLVNDLRIESNFWEANLAALKDCE